MRASGLFLPVSSLPGPYGIGSMGAAARSFLRFLKRAGQSYWQVLPLVPTSYGDSPYQSCSSAAGNPYFIDLDLLQETGLLTAEECRSTDFSQQNDRVDYEKLYQTREPLLRHAYSRATPALLEEFDAFCQEEASWLEDYTLFSAIKHSFNDVALWSWPDRALRLREPEAMEKARAELAEDCRYYAFVQFLFYRQWAALRADAAALGIQIIGDMPIYVSADSAEVWARPELFQLDADGCPTAVAGVPPDAFSDTGQLWGNPLYRWPTHRQEGYAWWLDRIRQAMKRYDVIRIDHFRGFRDYWSVPAGEETALNGHWEDGPGMDFVRAIRRSLPDAQLIAEDLGDLTDQARTFFRQAGFPGMGVLVQSFSPGYDSDYLPHNRPRSSVYYTSTHDSETFLEWLTERADPGQHKLASRYLRLRMDEGLAWGAVKAVWGSPAELAIAPLQDILGLGGDARINRPSTLGGANWQWRVRAEALNDNVAALLREVTETYFRLAPQ